jgi:hypothetical protein
MAEASLKLGGSWGVKEGSLLGFNDENGNYKPIPFDFTRATTATRVNRNGLIEEVQEGVPRIDFTGDGSLLLEPQRTNLITYSEDFSNAAWAKSNVSITSNSTTSPDGLSNGSLMTITGGTSDQRISDDVTYSGTNVFSIFAKANDSKWLSLRIGSSANKWFDLENGVLGNSTITTALVDSFIEDFGNGWYRCGIIFTDSSTTNTRIYPAENDLDITHTSGSVYIWGAQAESSSSYATSYIKTSGSAVTRNADVCQNISASDYIGQTEGTLYGEFDFKDHSTGTRRLLCLTDGSTSNRITTYVNTLDKLSVYIVNGGAAQADMQATTLTDGVLKYAVAYANNSIKFYLNGSQVGTDTSATIPATSRLYIGSENGNLPSYFNWKNCQLYKTALTDTELEELTTI